MADKGDGEENDNKNHITLATSENPRFLLDINSHELCMPSCSGLNGKVDYLEEEADVLNFVQIPEGSLASPENGCSFESCTFLDNTGSVWNF